MFGMLKCLYFSGTKQEPHGEIQEVDEIAKVEKSSPDAIPARMELDTGEINSLEIPEEQEQRRAPEEQIIQEENHVVSLLETKPLQDTDFIPNDKSPNEYGGGQEGFPHDSASLEKYPNQPEYDTDNDAQPPEVKDSLPGLAERRSMSESQLDKIGREEEGKEVEEDLDVRGVTKVTVNVPPVAK